METRCMAACVGKIRLQGLNKIGEDGLWAEDRWHPLYYAIRVEQVALPLYPQWGTEPNGYYIPPRWSPRGYIRQMFGPGVDNAIDRYIVPSRELLAVLQLWRTTQQIIFRYDVIPGPKVFETQIHGRKFEMYNDTVLAFNKSGKEGVRIQVEEPIYIRPAERVPWRRCKRRSATTSRRRTPQALRLRHRVSGGQGSRKGGSPFLFSGRSLSAVWYFYRCSRGTSMAIPRSSHPCSVSDGAWRLPGDRRTKLHR